MSDQRVVAVLKTSAFATTGEGVAPLQEISSNEAQTRPINTINNLYMTRNLAEVHNANQQLFSSLHGQQEVFQKPDV
jgi:hypothetical protein